jgi:hypothetical protein
MTYPDTSLDRVEAIVEALECHGHGRSIVFYRHGHEVHWPGENREYVPLLAGDLRDLVDQNKAMRRELIAELDRAERIAAIDDDLDEEAGTLC